jgi:citrate lyase beta subunit
VPPQIHPSRSSIAAADAAWAAGEGTIALDGSLVDEAMPRIARRHVALAEAFRLRRRSLGPRRSYDQTPIT